MKKTTWLIKIFYDDEKKHLLYSEEFKSVKAVRQKLFIKRDFLYDFERKIRKGLLNIKTSRKKKCLLKYKRMIIVKTTFGLDGPKQFVLDL